MRMRDYARWGCNTGRICVVRGKRNSKRKERELGGAARAVTSWGFPEAAVM